MPFNPSIICNNVYWNWFSINPLGVKFKYCNEIGKFQIFLESLEYQAVTLEVRNNDEELQ